MDRLSDAQFVEILTSSQVKLRSFALSLVRNHIDADDVLQNANIALWEKRQDYNPERDFFPWAYGILLIETLRYRRKRATDRLMFEEALVTTLAVDYMTHADELDRRRELLHDCVDKLSEEDQCLLEERYSSIVKPKEISSKRGCPVTTIYSALSRIRRALHRCIEKGLAQSSHPKLS